MPSGELKPEVQTWPVKEGRIPYFSQKTKKIWAFKDMTKSTSIASYLLSDLGQDSLWASIFPKLSN